VPFRTLSTLVGLIANLIPLYGVPYWQSHTFQLLMLYWMETVIFAFWTIQRIARLPLQHRSRRDAVFRQNVGHELTRNAADVWPDIGGANLC
jgi:hypothetical protein